MLRRILLVIAVIAFAVATASAQQSVNVADGKADRLNVYLFSQEGCPYCASARAELASLVKKHPGVKVTRLELGLSAANDDLYEKVLTHFAMAQAAVPLVVIGNTPFVGFAGYGRSAAAYEAAISDCLQHPCRDVIVGLGVSQPADTPLGDTGAADPAADERPSLLPETISVPFLGEVRTVDLSLPALTVILAGVDGFNPCAMWVLVFLIGLLLGLEDERRMWLLGGAFLLATAVMYFVVMAAWLNLVVILGAVTWLRLAIGALALGVGFYFLREYWTRADGVCKVVSPGRRQKMMDAFRATVQQDSLIWAVAGIMVLAVVVNLVELLCSAGVPAVYTQILTLNDLPLSTYYAYIALYIAVFMLDDVAIFATAMLALRVTGLTGSYARYSHLVGGIVLIAIGAVMVLRPELLTFG